MAEETIQELVNRCQAGARGMSKRNPNRKLLKDCVAALTQLTERLAKAENGPGPDLNQ